jgi:tetratricopeptide (TPR) repeat protein
MNNIKKILCVVIVFLTFTSNAQDKTLVDAFTKSYEFEYAKKYEAAISELNKVYNSSSYEINMRIGWLYLSARKNKEAISYYRKAIDLMPAATEPLWAIITPLSTLENWAEVEKIYFSILKLDFKNSTANYKLGLIYYYRKDYIKAKKFFDVSLNLFPFNYNNLLMSAWTNYFLGNKNEAKILFNKVLLYSPNDASAAEGLGLLNK